MHFIHYLFYIYKYFVFSSLLPIFFASLLQIPHGVEKPLACFFEKAGLSGTPAPLKKQPPGSAGRQLSQHALANPLLHIVEEGAKSYA